MIFVVLYVIASAALFLWVLRGARFKRLHKRVVNAHPEMQDVRQTDPLLVVRFGPVGSRDDDAASGEDH